MNLSLPILAESASKFHEFVEVLVYDDLTEIRYLIRLIDKIRSTFPLLTINLIHNSIKSGIAKSFIDSVMLIDSEYCWIIGADDFVFENSIAVVLQLIEKHSMDLLVVNKINFNLELLSKDKDLLLAREVIKNFTDQRLIEININTIDKSLVEYRGLNGLINKRYGNVFLGAIMVNIFKVSLRKSYQVPSENYLGFNTLDSTYPKIPIFASKFSESKNAYFKFPLILVGDGARDLTSNGDFTKIYEKNDFILQINISNEILLKYKANGMSSFNYYHNLSDVAFNAGYYIALYVLSKLLSKTIINNSDKISFQKSIVHNVIHPLFFLGLIRGTLKYIVLSCKDE